MLLRKYILLAVLILIFFSSGYLKVPHGIYVENKDNYARTVTLYVDGKESSTVYVPENRNKMITFYYLSEGIHNFSLLTQDNCGFKKFVSLQKYVSGREYIYLPLNTGRTKCPPRKISPPKKNIFRLKVDIKNRDDDGLLIRLDARRSSYTSTKFLYVPAGGSRTVNLSLKSGEYIVSILWSDPDEAGVKRSETHIKLVEDSELKLGTYRVEKYAGVYNPKGKISVIVENKDDDDLWVDMFLDDYSKTKYVPSGTKKFFGEYGRLEEGEHSIRLRWLDPDTYRYTFRDSYTQKVNIINLGKDESKQVTVSTELLK